MTLVTDTGFREDDWAHPFVALADLPATGRATPLAIDVPSETDPDGLAGRLSGADLVRIDFPSFADGRGFTIAASLRRNGCAKRTGRRTTIGHGWPRRAFN